MNRPTPEQARALAYAFYSAGVAWTRVNLAAKFATVVDLSEAERLAEQIIERLPRQPDHPMGTLFTTLRRLPYSIELAGPEANQAMKFGVPDLPGVADLALLLNVTPEELDWFADRGGWLRTADGPLTHYRYRQLPKRSGRRLVEAPKPRLREIQRTINRRILSCLPVHRACHGFEPGRSPKTFAAPHQGQDVLIRMDLQNFFPSITEAQVRATFAAMGYAPGVTRLLGGICTNASSVPALRGLDYEQRMLLRVPHLAQGAPTSPKLANLAARGLDRRIAGFARRLDLTYTRYADDIALSGGAYLNAGSVIRAVTKIATAEGFRVNRQKTLVRRPHQRQIIAGLVVNERPLVPRDTYDQVRALLHNCLQTGPASQNRADHPNFQEHVYGLISWIGETGPVRREKLLAMAGRVDWG